VGAQSTRGLGKICDFRQKSPFISETVRDRPMVAIERLYEVICALSNDDVFNDIRGPLSQFSRSRHFYVEYLKNFFDPWLTDKLLLNSNRKPNISNGTIIQTFSDL